MKNLTTDELLKILNNETDITDFTAKYVNLLNPETLPEFLNTLLIEKGVSKSDVIKSSNLDRTYAYQIFSGTKSPSRDKIIALAFGFGLSSSECNRMLMLAGFSGLYAKSLRDSCIIFSLDRHQTILTANETLHNLGENILS